MRISMIAAMDYNFCIGRRGGLPWPHLAEDMKRFRHLTMGKPVVMGRKTFDSIDEPLPGRTNIVLSRDTLTQEKLKKCGCFAAKSVNEILDRLCAEELVVLGGNSVFTEWEPLADTLYLTFIQAHLVEHGDTFFPIREDTLLTRWTEKIDERKYILRDQRTPHDLLFQTFKRKNRPD